MSKFKKRLLAIFACLIVLLSAGLLYVGNYMVDFAIVRKENHADVSPDSIVTEENAITIKNNRAILDERSRAWVESADVKKANITADDGLNLVADLFTTDKNSHKWLIGVHGYTGKKEDYHNIAHAYSQKGYNVLLPDMRSHGESEGVYIGMGYIEKNDILLWIDYIISIDPNAEIILHGTSMGAATVMFTSAENLPSNVKGIIEDCGFSTVWDIFEDELKYLFGLPAFPVLHTANFVANIRAGYDFKDASCIERVKKRDVPMLFIHGSEDNFVYTEMVYELYDACPTEKEMIIIDGAGHGEAYQMDPEFYFDTVFSFISKNCIAE